MVQFLELKQILIKIKIAKQAGINGTPTVQLFKEKLLKEQWQGVKQRSEFKEAIKNII